MKTLWALVRPYCTVSRVVTGLTAVLTPLAAVAIGKLAVVLAQWGYTLDETQALAVFLGGVAAVVAAVVPVVRRWLDGRAQFEVAMIDKGLAAQITSKSLASEFEQIAADFDLTLSLSDENDIAESDADTPDDLPRRERAELEGTE